MIDVSIEIVGVVKYRGIFDSLEDFISFKHYKVLSYELVLINGIQLTPCIELEDILNPKLEPGEIF